MPLLSDAVLKRGSKDVGSVKRGLVDTGAGGVVLQALATYSSWDTLQDLPAGYKWGSLVANADEGSPVTIRGAWVVVASSAPVYVQLFDWTGSTFLTDIEFTPTPGEPQLIEFPTSHEMVGTGFYCICLWSPNAWARYSNGSGLTSDPSITVHTSGRWEGGGTTRFQRPTNVVSTIPWLSLPAN